MLNFYRLSTFIFLFFISNPVDAQKINSYHQILASTDILEISLYLKNLKPDNPQQKAVLNRLKQLRNGTWKTEPRLLLSSGKTEPFATDEQMEFRNLIKQSVEGHNKKTVKLLNTLFSTNKEESESILLVRNNSSCDIILRLQGKEAYNLAVPSKGENFINLLKDSYLIKVKICNSEFSKTRDLTNSQILTFRYSDKN
ncbi:MAG: hypothetical protein EOO18_13660 [Chryseobacterium sp.]|nr:MAG: hypothetical protein EOO18_13660 [Chryseobacterium sp.]